MTEYDYSPNTSEKASIQLVSNQHWSMSPKSVASHDARRNLVRSPHSGTTRDCVPYQGPGSPSFAHGLAHYTSATDVPYTQPSARAQSPYPSPISDSISSYRGYNSGYLSNRSRSLPRSAIPKSGSSYFTLHGPPASNTGDHPLVARQFSPRQIPDVPSSIHPSLSGPFPRSMSPHTNNGMFSTSPYPNGMVAAPIVAQNSPGCQYAETPSATPTLLNLRSNPTKDSLTPILISSPSFQRSVPDPRQPSDRMSNNQMDFSATPTTDNASRSPTISHKPSTISGASHRLRPIPMLRLSSSFSLLRRATTGLSRPSVNPVPPISDLPANSTGRPSPKSRKGIPNFTSSDSSSPSSAYPSTYEERPRRERRLTRRLPRPENLTPGEGFDRCDAVYFNLNGTPGVRLKDLLERGVIVDDPDRPVFTMHKWRATLFAIHWPGYPESSQFTELKATDSEGNRIVRQHLAIDIAQKIQAFMEPILRRRTSRNISDPNDKWRISKQDGHSIDDVTLVSLHLYKNVWVPELVVAW